MKRDGEKERGEEERMKKKSRNPTDRLVLRLSLGNYERWHDTYHEHAAGVGREEDEDVPESVQIREVSIAPNGAEEAIVDPAEEAQEKSEERTNPQTNRARVTTSVCHGQGKRG